MIESGLFLRKLKTHLLAKGLPEYVDPYLDRDSLVRYCVDNNIGISTEAFPSNVISSEIKNTLFSEDFEEYHNYLFVMAFANALKELGHDSIYVYYDGFSDQPHARSYLVKLNEFKEFLESTEIPIYFCDDSWFFSPELDYGLCIFHHELLEFFGFGTSAKHIHQLTVKNVKIT